MADGSKNNKNLIIGICAAVVVIALVVVGVVMALKNGGGGLSDAYFESDNTKYVLTLDTDEMEFDNEEYAPIKTHLVYTYSGDDITGLKGYYEYNSNGEAEAAYNYFIQNHEGEFKSITVDGKYVVLEADESEYEDLTVDDVKQQIEFMEMMKDMNTDEADSIDDTATEGATEESSTEE